MNCQLAQEWMGEKLDGQLPPDRLAQLDAHLEGCASCLNEWKGLESSWDLLGSLPELEPGPLFRAQVWEKIRLEPPTPARPSWTLAWRRWLVALSAAAACAVGVVRLSAPVPLATPTATPGLTLEQDILPQGVQELGSLEVIPPLESLAQEDDGLETSMPLGDLSHDYLAMSHDAVDETLEEN